MKSCKELRDEIFELIKEYSKAENMERKDWIKGQRITYASRVFDENERLNLIDSALDFWLTAGKYAEKFESEFANYLGVRYAYAVSSGSAANLLAFMTLTSPLLKNRRILPGDEVITVAAAFPTTVAPIIQYGAVPVFVDINIPSYNIDCNYLEQALSEKTRAVFVAHTLGIPFDIKRIKSFCDEHGLWLIEDNCDALGAEVFIDGEWRKTGTIGDIGTSSFYPAHQMTMGEGGAVYTNNPTLAKIMLSMRDWGRDCVCPPGKDNTCGHRFDMQYGKLPKGYDHKYVYSHFGYNLKITEMQAAIGCAQLAKLPGFAEARRNNWVRLRKGLECLKDHIMLPEEQENTKISPFGFMVTMKNRMFDRDAIVAYLEERGVQTRMLFAGNIIKHPCFDTIRDTNAYRIVSSLENTDKIMEDSFFVGVYPGITVKQMDWMIESFKEFFKEVL